MKFSWLLSILLFPSISFASVLISEIAWMGGVESPNHEWIELHNTGSSVSVDGWMLHDANNLTIDLEGTILSGGRAVLERTSEATAPGSAFLLYTGALSNAGGTLVLCDDSGAVVDQVNGGENWENIGGDNTTKETAQLKSGVWYTAVATPGSAPDVDVVVSDENTESSDSGSSPGLSVRSDKSTEATRLVLPGISLQLSVNIPATVHVGQTLVLDVEPSGVGKTIADSLVYEWSMGNSDARFGKEAEYMFEYPGEYVVVVSGEYKRQKQFARQTVSVLPVELQLTKSDDGKSYVLHNTSDTEINVGGYRLVGTSEYTFPKQTIVLPRNKINLPFKVTNSARTVTALYDETGESIALHVPGFIEPVAPRSLDLAVANRAAATLPPTRTPTLPSANFGFASDPVVPSAPIIEPLTPVVRTPESQLAAAGAVPNPTYSPPHLAH